MHVLVCVQTHPCDGTCVETKGQPCSRCCPSHGIWGLSYGSMSRTSLEHSYLPRHPSHCLYIAVSLPSVGAASYVRLTFIMEVWILGGKQKLMQLKLSEILQSSCLVYSGGSLKPDFEMWCKIHYSNAPNLVSLVSILMLMWLPLFTLHMTLVLVTWLPFVRLSII